MKRDTFPEDLGGIFTADDFDLATLGFFELDEEEEDAAGEDTGEIPVPHDMESFEFYLWMEEEVEKEAARRRARKSAGEDQEKK